LRVLVADDDAGERSALVALLASYGCEVWEARDGLEAVQLASEHRPDARLRRVPGDEAAPGRPRGEYDPDSRAHHRAGAERHLRGLGFCGALTKPFTSAALLRAVVRCMDGGAAGRT
jgi:hypothetical protein